MEALAAQTRDKWGDLTPVVKVVPLLAEAVDEVKADIEAQGLDGVLLCALRRAWTETCTVSPCRWSM